ncbi:MAG TPA: sulfotransferase family 2 domain-containing protein [Candidatus Dormibacteraeota bacterium]|nr:sulfotransferase family 2 domain-containing protein [Candidatus Dormibacteraeota bacterium]
MIFHDKRVIFIHIQKTAGNAISAALGQDPDCPTKHFSASELRELYGSKIWDAYFKFAFVRNPWDRLVSWWSMINAARPLLSSGRLNKFHSFVLERATTFEEFLLNCDQEIADNDGRKWIYRNQIDYITDASDQLIVDFVGKFETLEADFAAIAKKMMGVSIQLPRTNQTIHERYVSYFTEPLANIVAERYRRDIDAFGYRFGY